ncbi:MAG: hypothetical protein Q4C60_03915 [Eubacteriales bacterium]|nr:hypothetical protein [Eubacteriales bacterium]
MILTEYNQERYGEFMREDGRLEGLQEGLQQGQQQLVRAMLSRHCSVTQISALTGLSEKEILEATESATAQPCE